nr:MAG TPA: hypothetical protein [Caudoviricetes sp.]
MSKRRVGQQADMRRIIKMEELRYDSKESN